MIAALAWCTCLFWIAAPGDGDPKLATPPAELIDSICDESLAIDAREKQLRSLEDFESLTADQLAKLNQAFARDADEDYSFYMELIGQLSRLGDERSLRLLLRHQFTWVRYKKSRPYVPRVLYWLSSRLKFDVWDNIHPMYRATWLRRGYRRVDGPKLEDIAGEVPLRVYRNTFTPETLEKLRAAAKKRAAPAAATPGCASSRAYRRP